MAIRRFVSRQRDFGIPIVSVGNLQVGGSGKTPMIVALAPRYPKAAVVSRGYGRGSKGLLVVSCWGEIKCSVSQSGDEAMLLAQMLPMCSVIVSEDRVEGIKKAKALGAEVILLDDGFNRVGIAKFELLLEPKRIANYLPLPAGGMREFYFAKKSADFIAKEGRDFSRSVEIEQCDEPMMLVTAIANPSRLEPYLPKGVIKRLYYPDHSYFDEKKLETELKASGAKRLLVTQKDYVKMEGFKLAISQMRLKLELSSELEAAVDNYIKEYRCKRI